MKTRSFLLRSAAVAVLAAAMPFAGSIPVSRPAAAAVEISIDFGTFYDELSPYGDWVSFQGRTVWVPTGQPLEWQPYGLGHWVYTRRHGWLWVSDEPFGWATYHYGRWGHGDDVGWYWVPGYRWAPAWVSWSRTDDYIGWSPLPLDYPDDGFGVNIVVGTVPDYYWQVVPAPAFLSVNLFGVIVHDRHRVQGIIRNSRHEGGVKFVDKTIVNSGIGIDFVEKKTKRKVRVHEVAATNRRDKAGKLEGDAVEVFAPDVKKGGDKKPKVVRSVDEVKAKRKKALGTTQETETDAQGEKVKKKDKVEKQTIQPDQQTGKKKQKVKKQPVEQQGDEQAGKKKKNQSKATIEKQPVETDGQAKKKKKSQTTSDDQPVEADGEVKKKKQKQ